MLLETSKWLQQYNHQDTWLTQSYRLMLNQRKPKWGDMKDFSSSSYILIPQFAKKNILELYCSAVGQVRLETKSNLYQFWRKKWESYDDEFIIWNSNEWRLLVKNYIIHKNNKITGVHDSDFRESFGTSITIRCSLGKHKYRVLF